MTAKPAKTLAALRQLACLGLPGKAVFPEAIELLRVLAGFELEGALYLDNSYQITDTYINPEVPPAVLLDYVESFHHRTDMDEVGFTAKPAMESRHKLFLSSSRVDKQTLMKTPYYDRIMRPIGMGWNCSLMLRDGKRPLAYIVVARSFASPDFSPNDVNRLKQAYPWVCHVLANGNAGVANTAEPLLPTGESATLILDDAGNVQSASNGALMLMHQASGVPPGEKTLSRTVRGDMSALLKRLARAVGATLHGKEGPLPAGTVRNEYGAFHLRAYALDAFAPGVPMQVALHIERHAPLSLRLFRSSKFAALSARERDVCQSILAGRSYTEIASHLGIKPSSVIQHKQSLYLRLGIRGQKELLPALFSTV